jgi:general secretion pathway protein D
MKRSNIVLVVLLALLLPACTTYRHFEKGRELEQLEQWDAALIEYSRALEIDPKNVRYQMALQRTKLAASRAHFTRAKSYAAAEQWELALIELQIVVELDPTNQFAAVELAKTARRVQELRGVQGRSIEEIKRSASLTKAQPPQLNPASDQPISLSFPRETPIKDIYRALGNAFGINIIFDQTVRDDRIAIELRDVTAQQALERLMQAGGQFYKVLDERTIIVVQDTPQTRRDYEDLVIRTFYLSNGDAEQVTNVVRTMIEARNVFPLKALNAITIRDTADKVRIAEKIIEANDKARAEVVVQVELLQLDLVKAREAGMAVTGTRGASGVLNAAGDGLITGGTLSQIGRIGMDDLIFTIPSITYSFVKNNSEARLLARPQLRISEGEKATLLIGQRVPIPVSTFQSVAPGTGGGFAPVTSYQYQDVGIKISVEPRVHHNREVTLRLVVEVSNLADTPRNPDGSPGQPIIGTRTIESTIRLKDGETNFLAGLIREDDSSADVKTPFFGDIPILGRLFSINNKGNTSTDLVLTMTPHIIRIPDITEDDVAPMWVGTQGNMTFRGVSPRLESPSPEDPFVQPRRDEQQFAPQPSPQGEVPLDTRDPFYVPPAGAPSDPFATPRPTVPPAPPPPPPDVQPRQPVSQFNSSNGTGRLAPQPASLLLKPGEMMSWSLVGMDLDGSRTDGISLNFDPNRIQVLDVSFGNALEYDITVPPVASINSLTGVISVRSGDGQALRFRSGGEVLVLKVRGMDSGESFLVVSDPQLTGSNGQLLGVHVTGGRVRVE